MSGTVAAALPSEYAAALPAVAPDVRAEMEHVERLFQAYEEAWRSVEAASEFMENPTKLDEHRWEVVTKREAEALFALLSYQDKSLGAFKIRADCIQMILQHDKLMRDLGENRDAFEVFINSVARF